MENIDKVQAEVEIKKIEALNALEGIKDTTLPALVKAHYSQDNPSPIIITAQHISQFKRKWLLRISKRKDKAMRKMAKLKTHFDRQKEIKNEFDLKAYRSHGRNEIIKLIIYCIFTAYMALYAPQLLPELVKNFFG